MSFKRLIVAFAAFPLLAGTASADTPVTTHVPVASPPACASAAGPAQHLPARAPLAIREQRAALAYAASRIGCLGRGASGRTALLRAFRETRALHRLATGGGSWRSIGPNTTKPQVYNFDTGAGTSPVSGRVLALAYDGHLNGGTLFAGTAGGGIWSTSNGGKSWTTHTDRMPSLAIDALAVDPTDPTGKTIYAGTGEQGAAGDAMLGAGIYKSTNGGLSWTVEGQHLFAGETVADIVLDPTSAGCVSPKTGCRVYAAESSTFGGFGGLAASTDGGKTWLFKTGTNISDQSVTALAIDSHGDIYASVSQPIPRAPTASNGIYVSSNHGNTWIRISKGLPGSPAGAGGLYYKMTLASPASALGHQVLYAVLTNPTNYNAILGVYRTSNGGSSSTSWTRIGTVGNVSNYEVQASYDIAIYADPADTSHNTVYLSLQNVYKTTNGLASKPTWSDLTHVFEPDTRDIHTDQHALVRGGGAVYFGNDGGVYVSKNNGSSFAGANGNLATLQFYGGAIGTSAAEGCTQKCDPSERLGGTQDNGTEQTDSHTGITWNQIFSGDGGYTAINRQFNQYVYQEYAYADISISSDGGQTWQQIQCPFANSGQPSCPRANFIAPLTMDPANPLRILSGQGDLMETLDGGATWHNISAAATHDGGVGAIAVSDTPQVTIYVANDQGDSWVSTNNGKSWGSMDSSNCASNPAPNCAAASTIGSATSQTFITALAADPAAAGTVYATVNSFQGAQKLHVFKSTNYGKTWTDVSRLIGPEEAPGLPDQPYMSLAINPAHPSDIYVGGVIGVFASTNGGASWSVLGKSLPNAAVYDLTVSQDGNTLDAWTHGRGVWELSGAALP